MKKVFIALVLCLAWSAGAQTIHTMETKQTDSSTIARLLEDYYFKGIYEGDLSLLNKVFYEDAILLGDVKGQPYAKTREQYLNGVANRQSPKDSGKAFKGTILDIRVVNSIAVVEAEVKMYDFNYHQFLSFHKLDGEWKLVTKMISDTNK